MIFDDTDFVVIESGPLAGTQPTTTYYANRQLARAYVETRRGLFDRIDICRVLTRVTTVLAPREVIEGDGLDG